MSLGISSSVIPRASLAAIFAIGNPVALLASAELRETRGFISITVMTSFGLDGELNIRTASFDTHFANDRGRCVAHALIFLVGKRLCRCYRNRIARMNAHRIEIFDRADHDEVVANVAHYFEFVFLPAENGFFDERLMNGACIESACNQVPKFLAIVGNRAAGAAEREGRANHERIADRVRKLHGFVNVCHDLRSWHFEANSAANVLEKQPVLGDLIARSDAPISCRPYFSRMPL